MVAILKRAIASLTRDESRWILGNKTTKENFVLVKINAARKPIDVGGNGYSAPTLYDVDDDGLLDLVVGMWSEERCPDGTHKQGRFLVYRNGGNKKSPQYESPYFLQAGEKIASVPVG